MRLLLLAPLLILLILFAVSNTQIVAVGLWPTGLSLSLPLAAAILTGMAFAFLLGATLVWVTSLGHRRRARRAEGRVAALQAELAARPPIATSTGAVVLPPPE